MSKENSSQKTSTICEICKKNPCEIMQYEKRFAESQLVNTNRNDKHDTLKQGGIRDNLHESALRLMCSDCQQVVEINGEIGEFKTISHKCPENVKIIRESYIPHREYNCPRYACRSCAN